MSLPDFMKNYFYKLAEKYISASPSNKIDIEMTFFPLEGSKGYYDYKDEGGSRVFWDGYAWLPHDLILAYNFDSNKKIKELDKNDAKIIADLLGEVKGSLSFKDLRNDIAKIQDSFFKKKKPIQEAYSTDIRRLNESEEDNKAKEKKELTEKYNESIDEIYRESLKKISELTSSQKSYISSREDVLSEILNKFGKDITYEVKSIILGNSDKDKMVKSFRDKVILKKDKIEEYVPEKDEKKERFNKKDQLYVVQQIVENKESGLQAIIKNLRKFYNEELINEIILAARYYGGIDGLLEYFSDYDSKRKNLRLYGLELDTPLDIKSLTKIINDIRVFLNSLKKEYKTTYIGSVYEELEEVIDMIQKYQRTNKRDLDFENEILNFFGPDGKLLKRLKKTKLPVVSNVEKLLAELRVSFDSAKKIEVPLEKGQKDKNKKEEDKGDTDLLKKIKKMINNSSEDLSEEDEKISKKFFDTYQENIKKLRDMDLSGAEILKRKKEFDSYMEEKNKIKKWLQMTPEERLESDKLDKSNLKIRERIEEDYKKYWSKLSPTERDVWIKDNNLTPEYVKALNDFGAQLDAVSKKDLKVDKKQKGRPKTKVVLSPEEQEALEKMKQRKLDKQVKSSYVIEKIEKTSSMVEDPLISAELYDIAKKLKTII